ncbi:uncharacterized protein LOC142365438 isoform X1 [Opisthocomus hoazin]|uniref:uncharacterized protein LOC142365438 isoform X1 n=1 Tax=Opisthocomus hoazin TaxID=30419 RepID=UPI003F52E8F6
MTFVPLLLLLLLLGLLLLLALRPRAPGRLPPGPPALPLLGNLLQISPTSTLQSLLKLSKKYGPVFTVYVGSRRVVVLSGHAAVREALVGNAEAFAGRGRLPTVEETFRGHGVVFSGGERWRQLRRFSLTTLRDFGMGRGALESRIQEEAQALLQELRRTQGQPFDPTFKVGCAVSNVICSVVFGNRFEYGDPEFLELLQMINEVFQEIGTPWAQFYDMAETFLKHLPGPHTKVPRLLARVRSFIARRVQDNARSLEPGCPRDFIDCFLLQMEKEKHRPGSEFTLENLELTVLNLFFAGTETVGSTLRYGFLMLMKHPEVQEKVQEEIERVIGRGRVPAAEDRGRMPYTDAVIHELQRCGDLLPLSLPHRVTRDTLFRGYLIPKLGAARPGRLPAPRRLRPRQLPRRRRNLPEERSLRPLLRREAGVPGRGPGEDGALPLPHGRAAELPPAPAGAPGAAARGPPARGLRQRPPPLPPAARGPLRPPPQGRDPRTGTSTRTPSQYQDPNPSTRTRTPTPAPGPGPPPWHRDPHPGTGTTPPSKGPPPRHQDQDPHPGTRTPAPAPGPLPSTRTPPQHWDPHTGTGTWTPPQHRDNPPHQRDPHPGTGTWTPSQHQDPNPSTGTPTLAPGQPPHQRDPHPGIRTRTPTPAPRPPPWHWDPHPSTTTPTLALGPPPRHQDNPPTKGTPTPAPRPPPWHQDNPPTKGTPPPAPGPPPWHRDLDPHPSTTTPTPAKGSPTLAPGPPPWHRDPPPAPGPPPWHRDPHP